MAADFPFRLRLHPRHRIDIGWNDLWSAARDGDAAEPADPAAIFRWPDGRTGVACLSERTGFDALLSALALPPGSEMVASAVNIATMAEVAAAHGLTIKAVDLSLDTLLPSPDVVARAVTTGTALVLIAHLYGAADPLVEIAEVCRQAGVLLVEDGAQAWSDSFRGSRHADVSLFSFGPIKTATALGGGVVVCRDPALTARVAEVLGRHPPLPDAWFRRRLLKYAGFKAAARPEVYAALVQAMRWSRRDPDAVIGGSARGFGPADLLPQLRRAPPPRLRRLLTRRLEGSAKVQSRRRATEDLIAQLADPSAAPGRRATTHAHWLAPLVVDDPERLIADLRRSGFDATRGATSLRTIGVGDAPEAERLLRRVVYLPALAGLAGSTITRLARAVDRSRAGTRP